MDDFESLSESSNKLVQDIQNNCDENIDKLSSVNSYGTIEITECVREANRLVDDAIEQSNKYIGNLQKQEEEENTVPNIQWFTIDEFSVDNGLQMIEKFIKTWERGSGWLYCIDFLCKDICPYSKRYWYRVQWSIPTRRKPIPRATASVYFTIDVSDIMPKNHMVKVFYIFESSKLVHRPGESRFREKWLRDIVEAKIALMETVTF